MARPTQHRADTVSIRKLFEASGSTLDLRPVIAYTMSKSGCTSTEIGTVFNVSRQMADNIVARAERKIGGNDGETNTQN
jgi:hypothetical protein